MSQELKQLREKTKTMREEVEIMEQQLAAHMATLGITYQLNVDEERINREIYKGDFEEYPAAYVAAPPKLLYSASKNASDYAQRAADKQLPKKQPKSVVPTSPAPQYLSKRPSQKLSAPSSRESGRAPAKNAYAQVGTTALTISGISLATQKK